MPIDPAKMAAFAGSGSAPDDTEPPDEGGEKAKKGSALARYAMLLPAIEEYAEEVQECIDSLDRSFLAKPDDEAEPASLALLQMCLGQFTRDLLSSLKESLAKGIDAEDALAVAKYLADTDTLDDAKIAAGWLQRVGQVMLSGAPIFEAPEDDFDEGDDVDVPDDDLGDLDSYN